jgi:nitrite reductase/ring-hydroxylating ferredoxin subunit
LTANFVRVGSVSEFEPGALHAFVVGGRNVAVVQLEDAFYAFENFCTHEAVMFTSGYGVVAASSIICMLHGSIFSLATGEVINGPASDPVASFEVRVDGDDVLVADKPR